MEEHSKEGALCIVEKASEAGNWVVVVEDVGEECCALLTQHTTTPDTECSPPLSRSFYF